MTIKIGMISYWHVHAWDYTKQAQAHSLTEIAAVWDEEPDRGRKTAEQLGVPFYEQLDDMLTEGGIDAVIVNAPTNMHRDVMLAAARAGKHIFTEKVIAPTLREAQEITSEVAKQGVKLTVSLPRLNDGSTLAILDVLEKKLLGKITYVRVRLSHNGAVAGWLPEHFYRLDQCGGGALIDLGCHPMYLTRLFLGEPVTGVNASFGYITGREVEDNALATLYTESGAIGAVEAGFVNSHSPFSIEVHGTEGTLLYGTPEERLLLKTNRAEGGPAAWTEVPVQAGRESAFDQWVSHIQNGTTADENIAAGVELTRLMEAANTSAKEGRVIQLKELNA